jgi:alpha-tubulin suppressor-like RCC1 family protein
VWFKLILVCAVTVILGQPAVASAEVWTDEQDYAPGSVVTISGNNDDGGAPGYVQGASVDVDVRGPDDWHAGCSATVDAGGAWSCTITLDEDPAIAVGDYTYTASSTDGGGNAISEQGAFSDGADSLHTCVVTASGGALCWGYNFRGQLGDGTSSNSNVPVAVQGLAANVAQISTGGNHSCALTTDGAALCWGDNTYGQLGDGTTTGSPAPHPVQGLGSGVAQISAGERHTCALTTSGGVLCWGAGGRLGNDTFGASAIPVPVYGLGSGVVQISAGESHTCAVTATGQALCWGFNDYGQLGVNPVSYVAFRPEAVSGLSSGVAQISAGAQHTCAVTTGGEALCWGYNYRGQLGDGSNVDRHAPVTVYGLSSGVAQISAGDWHSCALTTGGGVQCWGIGPHFSVIGNDMILYSRTAVEVSGLGSGIVQVSAGVAHTCALTNAGGVKCWGGGRNGELGNGAFANSVTAVDVSGLSSGVSSLGEATLQPNLPPVADAGGPYRGDEGAAIVLDGATASDPDMDALTVSWQLSDPATCSVDDNSSLNPTVTCLDDGNFTATLTVNDGRNPAVSSDVVVTVDNVAPVALSLAPSTPDPVLSINTPLTLEATFSDAAGSADEAYSCAFDWDGDGSADATVSATYGACSESVSYALPGVYTVTMVVADKDGALSAEIAYLYVVVYDPDAGFVTGGGWIDSPAGAYSADAAAGGKANFGFVAKYRRGANVPDGNTQFHFKAGDLNFHSTSYEWLVVAGQSAQFRGQGTINGEGSYTFMISAGDGSPDTFRIHIWGDNGTVYDNGSQQALGGGSVVIHN